MYLTHVPHTCTSHMNHTRGPYTSALHMGLTHPQRATPRIELGTSSTRKTNHTTRPSGPAPPSTPRPIPPFQPTTPFPHKSHFTPHHPITSLIFLLRPTFHFLFTPPPHPTYPQYLTSPIFFMLIPARPVAPLHLFTTSVPLSPLRCLHPFVSIYALQHI